MRIKYLINYHGGDGYRNMGQIEDVSEEKGKALIKLSYAQELPTSEPEAKPVATKPVATKEAKAELKTQEAKPKGKQTKTPQEPKGKQTKTPQEPEKTNPVQTQTPQ